MSLLFPVTSDSRLDDNIRTVVRGQTNVGQDGRQVGWAAGHKGTCNTAVAGQSCLPLNLFSCKEVQHEIYSLNSIELVVGSIGIE